MMSKWLTILVTISLIVPASAQIMPRHHFTLSLGHLARAIAQALAQQGIEADTTQIEPVTNVIATEPNPVLDVRSVQSRGDRTMIELSCHQRAVCLPFFAIANTPIRQTNQPEHKQAAASSITMRTGTRGTLHLEDEHTHLQLSVVSLESGPAGRTIRVRSTDRKRIYSARIVDANTLEARF